MPVATLKKGHVQPVWAGHPWVYAQAVAHWDGDPEPGAVVDVRDAQGHFLGRGLYSPGSAIPVRLYTRLPGEEFDAALVSRRVREAKGRRETLGLPGPGTSGYRLVNAEGDGLPGLIVDRYSDSLVVQIGTRGIKDRQELILDALMQELAPKTIIDQTSVRAAQLEGFRAGSGPVRGEAPPALAFEELGMSFEIAPGLAQKTGYYFDQRPLRRRIEILAQGRRVLDTFCYVGSMSLLAARGGAREVVGVDTSRAALDAAERAASLNGLTGRVRFEHGDAHQALARAAESGEPYDLVICDPPKLAPRRADRESAVRTLRHLVGLCARATREHGLLVLSSCSAALGAPDVLRAVALGARDAARVPVVLEQVFQGGDHPVPAAFPQGLYLSTVIVELGPGCPP